MSETRDRVRICLVGAGRAGIVHGRNYARAIPGAEVVAVVDTVASARDALAQELGGRAFETLPQALESVTCDAVCIATPTFTHHALALLAAAAGKHILCEKPMALTAAEGLAMIAAVRRAGVIFQMGFMRRYDAEYEEAHGLIAQGAIGRVIFLRSLTRGPGLPPRWALDTSRSHGLFGEVNSHDVDVIRWLSGSEFVKVYAQARALKALDVLSDHPDFYDVGVVLGELGNAALATIDGACPVEYGYDARVEVLGTEGMLSVGALPEGALLRVTRDGQVAQHTFRSWRDRHRSAYLRQDQAFVESIRTGRSPRAGAVDGLRALEVVLAAVDSLRSGRAEPVQRHETTAAGEAAP